MISVSCGSPQVPVRFLQHDDRFLVCEVNGRKFTVITASINGERDVALNLPGHSVVLLNPITSQGNITIDAIDVFVLKKIKSIEGDVKIRCSGEFLSVAKIKGFNVFIRSKDDNSHIAIDTGLHQRISSLFMEGCLNENSSMLSEAFAKLRLVKEDQSMSDRLEEIEESFNESNLSAALAVDLEHS